MDPDTQVKTRRSVEKVSGARRGPEKSVNVQVAVRCRPPNEKERTESHSGVVICDEDAGQISTPGSWGVVRKAAAATGRKTYSFDTVFGATSTQRQVYETVCAPLVSEVLEGFNCTVFAYGQTGTGKTHTMEGLRSVDDKMIRSDERSAGLIPRAVQQIFSKLRKNSVESAVRVSHLELYNEQMTDLLSLTEDAEKLRIYDDEKTGTFVVGLTEITVQDEKEVFDILQRSAKRRITAETEINKSSSRSHSIFSVTVHSRSISSAEGDEMIRLGKLNLVDLAGSENIGRSGAVHQRAREAGNINQSLLALGKVINALVEHQPHVPYRDSKLTRMLQESLGGKNKTCIIATIGPAASSLEETISTLEYAFRAKSIKNKPTVNSVISKKELLNDYTRRLAKLERELLASREKNGVYLPLETYNKMNATIQALEEKIGFQEQTLKDKDDAIIKLNKELNETFTDLKETQTTLAETETDLNRSHSKLNSTERELAQTLEKLAETSHLLGCHESTESELHEQAAHMKTALVQSVQDLSVLHGKFDDMVEIEAADSEAVHTFRSHLSTSRQSLDARISELFSEQAGLIADLEGKAAQTKSDLAKNMDLVVSTSGKLQGAVAASADKLLEHVDGAHAEAASAAETLQADLTATGAQMSSAVRAAVQEKQEQRCEELCTELTEVEGELAQLSSGTKSFNEGHDKAFADLCSSHDEIIAGVAHHIQRGLADASTRLDSAGKTAAQIDRGLQTKCQKLAADGIASFRSLLDVYVSSIENAEELELSKALEEISLASKSADELASRVEHSVRANCSELAAITERLPSIESAHGELASGLGAASAENLDEAKILAQELLEKCGSHQSELNKILSDSEAHVGDLVQFESSAADVFQKSQKSLIDELDSRRELADKRTMRILDGMREDVGSVLAKVMTEVRDITGRSSKLDEEVAATCQSASDAVSTFVQKEFKAGLEPSLMPPKPAKPDVKPPETIMSDAELIKSRPLLAANSENEDTSNALRLKN